jgi:hypothetical protein
MHWVNPTPVIPEILQPELLNRPAKPEKPSQRASLKEPQQLILAACAHHLDLHYGG